MNSTKKLKTKKRRCYFAYDFVRVTGAIPMFLWFRLKVIRFSKNSPKKLKGRAVIAPNHISELDPVIVHVGFWYRRFYCLATKDLFNTPLKEKFFKLMNCIMVDKKNPSISVIKEPADRLREGKAVIVFPEGKLHSEEKLIEYKSGAVLIAHLGEAPIIPVYIVKPKKWYNRTKMIIGEPFLVSTILGKIPSMAEIEQASDILRQKENELKEFYLQYEKRGK